MSDNKYSNLVFEDPSNEVTTTELPRADGGVISIPAAVAGAGLIYKVGMDWVPKLKSETAVIVKYLSSEPGSDTSPDFIAMFEIENISMHTVYIENIEVIRPNTGTEVRQHLSRSLGWGATTSTPSPLPWQILAGKSLTFAIAIDKNRLPIDVDKNPYGEFKIKTSILHHKRPNTSKEIIFRIRGH